VLLGRRVAAAFGLASAPYLEWTEARGRTWVVMPHPSGVNRWWNDEENRLLATVAALRIREEAPRT
jgi:hypothetical protein